MIRLYRGDDIKCKVLVVFLIVIVFLSSCSVNRETDKIDSSYKDIEEKDSLKQIIFNDSEKLIMESLGLSNNSIIAYSHNKPLRLLGELYINIEFFEHGKSKGVTKMEVSLSNSKTIIASSKHEDDCFNFIINGDTITMDMESIHIERYIQSYEVNKNDIIVTPNNEFVLAVRVRNRASDKGVTITPEIPSKVFSDADFDFSDLLKNDIVCIITGVFVDN